MSDLVQPDQPQDQHLAVITCLQDEALCSEVLHQGLLIASSEFILTGILQHKLHPNKYPF